MKKGFFLITLVLSISVFAVDVNAQSTSAKIPETNDYVFVSFDSGKRVATVRNSSSIQTIFSLEAKIIGYDDRYGYGINIRNIFEDRILPMESREINCDGPAFVNTYYRFEDDCKK